MPALAPPAGSVWGGTATLVEEASIGVETGEAPYLLGTVSALSAHDDRIFLLDGQVPDRDAMPWNRSMGLRSIREGSVAEDLRPLPDLGYTTPRIEQSVRGHGVAVAERVVVVAVTGPGVTNGERREAR